MAQITGKATLLFDRPPRIIGAASIVGSKESDGPLGHLFDCIEEDPKFGKNTWEEAESELQLRTARKVLEKTGLTEEEVRYLFAGDLLAQGIATSYGIMELQIPLFELYGACSTCGESLSLAAMCISAGYAGCVMALTSSHFASAEKEFRFPLEYAGQRPLSTTWTVTGAGAFLLASEDFLSASPSSVCITGITTGKIVDYGVKDSMHMGAAMAPAAADTIARHLHDTGRTVEDYDRIITGDLGSVGQTILKDLLREQNIEPGDRHEDCGILIYDPNTQDTHAGGSGCGCSASVLASYILPKLRRGEWKRVLFLPTGALLSKVSFNEGQSIPGIAMASCWNIVERRFSMNSLNKEQKQKYQKYIKEVTPTHSLPLEMGKAFLTGGLICVLGQFLINTGLSMGLDEEAAGTWCSILLVLLSVLLTGFNLYPSIAKWGGAGALVPITGFANGVASAAIEYKKEGQVFGIGSKIFTIAGPVILYGVVTSWILGLIFWLFL